MVSSSVSDCLEHHGSSAALVIVYLDLLSTIAMPLRDPPERVVEENLHVGKRSIFGCRKNFVGMSFCRMDGTKQLLSKKIHFLRLLECIIHSGSAKVEGVDIANIDYGMVAPFITGINTMA